MQIAITLNKERMERARRELLAKAYAIILADDWKDKELAATAEKPKTMVDENERDV